MIPAVHAVFEEGSEEKMKLLQATYPKVFEGSIRYLRKPAREFIEKMK
jgi:hypothetical protein